MPILDELVVQIRADAKGITKGVGRANRAFKGFGKSATSAISSVGRKVVNLKGLLVGLAASFGAFKLGESFLRVGKEFENFNVQLKAVMDGNKQLADQTMKWVREFAAKTPFMTQEVIAAFVQLQSVGINVTKDIITTLGDVAFVFNRDIRDVASALVSFETETLRRLGIEIDRTGKKVVITSGKMRVETDSTAQAIREGLIKVWAERFPDAMQEAENTYTGLMALMKSEIDEFKAAVAEKGVFKFIQKGLKGVLDQIGTLRKEGKLDKWAKDISDATIEALASIVVFAAGIPATFDRVTASMKKSLAFIVALGEGFTKIGQTALKARGLFVVDPEYKRILDEEITNFEVVKRLLEEVGIELQEDAQARERSAEAWGQWGSNVKKLVEDTKNSFKNFSENVDDETAKTKEVLKEFGGVWRNIRVEIGKPVKPAIDMSNAKSDMEEVRRIYRNMRKEMERPITIKIEGKGSRVLPISEKIEEIKRMFGTIPKSMNTTFDMASFSDAFSILNRIAELQIRAARLSAVGTYLPDQYGGFKQNPVAAAEQSAIDRMTRMFEGFFRQFFGIRPIDLRGANFNFGGAGNSRMDARTFMQELMALQGRL